MTTLLPCPFCGVMPVTKEWIISKREQIKIICDGDYCHVQPSVFGNKKTMTEIWNTRADLVPEPVTDAAAEAAIAKINNQEGEVK
jgi:hypothetical protein